MHKHTYRTILIYAVILVALFQIYPTIGWMLLSPEQRQTRLDIWEAEDAVYHEPDLTREISQKFKRWAQFDRSRVINLGLDLQGGIHMVIGFEPTEEQEERGFDAKATQQLVLQTIRRRISEFEAREPIIQALGDDQIQIQLPGEKDIDRAIKLIKRTAHLTFHIVAGQEETLDAVKAVRDAFPERFTPFLLPPAPGHPWFRVSEDHVDKVRTVLEEAEEAGDPLPEGKVLALSQPPNPWDEYQGYYLYLMDREPLMTGEGLRMAMARPDDDSPGNWQILFEFGGAAAQRFGEVTEAHIGDSMGIVLDGVVCGAPVIRSKITSVGTITGSFSPEQARDLAIALNSGSMPVKLREDYTGVVGASLGADSVRKGVTSSLIGIAIVALFMLLYYRVAGLIANVALVLNAVLILGALAYFNSTLTLPGIAGLILTVGMAVDANVLVFERIREELRNGKSILASIESGYNRATVTILDANVTTLIAAAVLMEFGTGPIEGFAVTLSIGVCSSVFTALIVTRAIFDFLTAHEKLATLTMMAFLKPDSKPRFMNKRRYAFTASAVVIVIGLFVFGIRGSDNFGVDFTEGTNMMLSIERQEPVDVGQVRASLEAAGFDTPIVQRYEQGDEQGVYRFVIRIAEVDQAASEGEESETVTGRVNRALDGMLAGEAGSVTIDKVETVGPSVGKELRNDAIKAISYALVFIIAYLWFRFELKFAFAAVLALVHDVLVTVGIFAVVGKELSMPVVAALLTIIGYSLNDTIVVFDRVREDMQLYRGRGLHFADILDTSINQTLSRTLLTSLTTLFVVVVLFIFGGSVINDFAFALIIGVVVGTYSSIFVASPAVYLWQKFQGKHISPSEQERVKAQKKQKGKDKKTENAPA